MVSAGTDSAELMHDYSGFAGQGQGSTVQSCMFETLIFHSSELRMSLCCANLLMRQQELDDYAPEPEVHKYLHSRLMHFDVPMLYEMHYNSITLGKVRPSDVLSRSRRDARSCC